MTYGTRSGGDGFRLSASLRQWVKGWRSGKPHFVIGPRYLLRWYVLPRNPWLNVYLHKFLHDDEDRALHDHPWWFVSVMLKGGYFEITQSNFIKRSAPSVAFRKSIHAHRVVLPRFIGTDVVRPCWTLVITGRHWKEFTAADDYGQVGRGCD